ncbi:MAG: PKD domain-containing protein [Acidobacteriia bacterium]|nr:PKD domain-containing protein [Terriglobia bacterium]
MRVMKSSIVLWVLLFSSAAFAQNQPPVAEAGPDMTVILNQNVSLNGTASYDPDGDQIMSWDWEVVTVPAGAASPLQGADTPKPLFTGNVIGDYILSLSVFDGQFWSARDFLTVTVAVNQPPVAVIEATPTRGAVPLTVYFDGNKSYDPEGGAIQFFWQFGDGGSSALPLPSHTYTEAGTYVATLTVTDPLGAQDQNTVAIIVFPPINQPPVCSPTATPNAGQAPLTVQFAANASDPDGDPLTFTWTFGDGGTSTAANPVHTYVQPGNYIPELTVSDSMASVSASLVIAVGSSLTMSVLRAEIDYKGVKSTTASVKLTADFAGVTPQGNDVLAISADGVSLFAAPFSRFEVLPSDPNSFKLKLGNDAVVMLDLATPQITFVGRNLNMAGVDLSNGLDVQLTLGQAIAVDNVALVLKPSRQYIYID